MRILYNIQRFCLEWSEYVVKILLVNQVHHGSNRYCLDKNYGGFLSVKTFLQKLNSNSFIKTYLLLVNHAVFLVDFPRSGIECLALSKT